MLCEQKVKYMEYREAGTKIKGAGFVKMERWGDSCRILVQISGLPVNCCGEKSVYLIGARKEILLGAISLEQGRGRLEFQGEKNFRSAETEDGLAAEIAEMVRIPIAPEKEVVGFLQESASQGRVQGGRRVSENTERSAGIRKTELSREETQREAQKKEPKAAPEGPDTKSVQAGTETVPEKTREDRSKDGKQPERIPEPEAREAGAARPEKIWMPEARPGRTPEPKSVEAAGVRPERIPEPKSVEAAEVKEAAGARPERIPEPKSVEAAEAREAAGARPGRIPEPKSVEAAEVRPERIPEPKSVETAEVKDAGAARPEKIPEPEARETAEMRIEGEPRPYKFQTTLQPNKWEQLQAIYPRVKPFGDNREYLRISPGDFVVLKDRSYRLANNSFLLHGYFNYKHLILHRTESKGEKIYFVGVPGNFYEKEKEVAVLFGFECFECAREPAREGDFGYYMMRVEL